MINILPKEEPCTRTYSFSKSLRLLTPKQYSTVFDNAPIRASHPQILILAQPNNLTYPRMGLVVAKKNAKLAVSRNRFKRLVRESFRMKQHNIPPIDAIVLARRGTENLTNSELTSILNGLWKRLAKQATKISNQQG